MRIGTELRVRMEMKIRTDGRIGSVREEDRDGDEE
jgi:hypothetical protein